MECRFPGIIGQAQEKCRHRCLQYNDRLLTALMRPEILDRSGDGNQTCGAGVL
jgi:hypothetical protein